MNTTNNATTANESPRETRRLFSAALYTVNIPLTVIGNLLICWVVYKYQRLKTPDNMLLASLSCANILSAFVFVSRLVIYFSPSAENSSFCSMLTIFYNNLVLLTTMHLCTISIDRMLAIKYPLRYPLWVTNKRALSLASLLWVIFIVSLIVKIVLSAAQEDLFWKHMTRCYGGYGKNPSRQYSRKPPKMTILGYAIPFLIMLISYSVIFKVVREQAKKAYPETQKQAKRKSELKAAKTIGLLIGAFVIFYTPLYICSMKKFMEDGRELPAVRRASRRALKYLGYLSSCAWWINPIIYASTNKEVKEHLKKLFSRICRKTTPTTESV